MKTTRRMNLKPWKKLNLWMNPNLRMSPSPKLNLWMNPNLNPRKNLRQSLNPRQKLRLSQSLNLRLAGASFAGCGLCSGLRQGMCL